MERRYRSSMLVDDNIAALTEKSEYSGMIIGTNTKPAEKKSLEASVHPRQIDTNCGCQNAQPFNVDGKTTSTDISAGSHALLPL